MKYTPAQGGAEQTPTALKTHPCSSGAHCVPGPQGLVRTFPQPHIVCGSFECSQVTNIVQT